MYSNFLVKSKYSSDSWRTIDLHLKLTYSGWFILRVWVAGKRVSFSPWLV
jgi:hypothetical protein